MIQKLPNNLEDFYSNSNILIDPFDQYDQYDPFDIYEWTWLSLGLSHEADYHNAL